MASLYDLFDEFTKDHNSFIASVSNNEEGLQLDYKCHAASPKDADRKTISKALSAFANSTGGVLVLGVRENQKTKPIPEPIANVTEYGESLRSAILDWMHPQVSFDLKVILEPGSDSGFIVIKVSEGNNKPYMARYIGGYYTRAGKSSSPMSGDMVRAMSVFSHVPQLELQTAWLCDQDKEYSFDGKQNVVIYRSLSQLELVNNGLVTARDISVALANNRRVQFDNQDRPKGVVSGFQWKRDIKLRFPNDPEPVDCWLFVMNESMAILPGQVQPLMGISYKCVARMANIVHPPLRYVITCDKKVTYGQLDLFYEGDEDF